MDLIYLVMFSLLVWAAFSLGIIASRLGRLLKMMADMPHYTRLTAELTEAGTIERRQQAETALSELSQALSEINSRLANIDHDVGELKNRFIAEE